MDDAVLVRGFERLGDLPRHRQRLVDGEGAARDSIGERRAFDQLHHQRVLAAGILEAVDLRDVRMIERREELRFPAEPRQAIGIVGDGGQQDLDRHVAIQLRIARAIDLAHPTRADARRDLVAAEPLALEVSGSARLRRTARPAFPESSAACSCDASNRSASWRSVSSPSQAAAR